MNFIASAFYMLSLSICTHTFRSEVFRNQLKICQSVPFVLLFHTFSNSIRLICADIPFLSKRKTRKLKWNEKSDDGNSVRGRERETIERDRDRRKNNWNIRTHGIQINWNRTRTHLCSTYLLILLTFVRNLTFTIRVKCKVFAI